MATHERTGPASLLPAFAALVAAAFGVACGTDDEERAAALMAAERQGVAAVERHVAATDSVLARQPGLIAADRSRLRRYLNKQQVATARRLGVGPVKDSAEVRDLVRQGRLVPLEDSTEYWIVRELDASVPYVTPDTRAMLEDVGRQFHARLDSLGLPPFRFEISSVLRTAAMQARLRGGNPNASRTTSSHEFGTTIDIAYNNFAPPADVTPFVTVPIPDTLQVERRERDRIERRIEEHARLRLSELGEERAAELKGILGGVLRGMQEENKVQPLIERSQPVYHMTVAQRYPAAPTPELTEE